MLDSDRIRIARGLFSLGATDEFDMIIESFSTLSGELATRAMMARQPGIRSNVFSRFSPIAATTRYTATRLMDFFARLQMIDWMNDMLSDLPDEESYRRRMYLGMAIKDFHVDVVSLMDSVAPALIQTNGQLKPKDKKALPGWPAIQRDSERSYRQDMPDDLLKLVDSTNRWLPTVKKVRDVLTHRDHQTLIFGKPSDGILFQVYEGIHTPRILDPVLLYSPGVVDFELYSAFIVAEILALFDDLGERMAVHLNVVLKATPPTLRMGNYKGLVHAMDRLQELLEQTGKQIG